MCGDTRKQEQKNREIRITSLTDDGAQNRVLEKSLISLYWELWSWSCRGEVVERSLKLFS